MTYSAEAMGAVIRTYRLGVREDPRMTQKELGKEAGYQTGAGVSVSRIESGQMRPSPERLEKFAKVFGVTVQEMEEKARRRDARGWTSPSEDVREGGADKPRERAKRVQAIVERRQSQIEELIDAFNAAHDGARDEFFMPFVARASTISKADEPPDPRLLGDVDDDAPPQTKAQVEARYRLSYFSHGVAKALAGTAGGISAGATLGAGAAYATFSSAAFLGTASTGTAISALSGAAATKATLALLGGGSLAAGGSGIAGGTMLLSGIVAAPALIVGLGGLAYMVRRSRAQEAKLLEQVTLAEAELRDTRENYKALVELVSGATKVLDDLQVHAARSVQRWTRTIPDGPVDWTTLSSEQKSRYQDFVTLAGCQLSVANLPFDQIMGTQEATDLDEVRLRFERTIETAQDQIDDIV